MIAFDETTMDYVKGRPYSPKDSEWDMAINQWKDLHSDPEANFDKEIQIDVSSLKPQVTWGTSPEMVIDIDSEIPCPRNESEKLALEYMGLQEGMKMEEINCSSHISPSYIRRTFLFHLPIRLFILLRLIPGS